MPITALGKKIMLDALFRGTTPANFVTHVGLLTKGANRNVTGTAATDIISDTGHTFANGDMVIFSAITGGTGLDVGRVYFVINQAANQYQLSLVPGGAAVNFSADLTATSTLAKYTEITGGSPAYARKAIAYSAAADDGTIDDSTNGALFDVPAAAQVDAVGYYSAITAGSCYGVDGVTQEVFASQGQYNLTDSKIDANQFDEM
jgi:hypothetical protein